MRLLQKRITGKVLADYEEYEKTGAGEPAQGDTETEGKTDEIRPEKQEEIRELITLLLCEEICRRRRERRKRVLIPNKM